MLLPHTVTPVPPGSDDEPAVTVGGRTLSRTDLIGASTAVAERLRGLGVRGPVAVWAEPTVATVIAFVGALRAGVPAVPVPPDSGSAEVAHVLADAGVQAWLGVTPDDPQGLPAVPVREHARGWHALPEPPASAIALIMYTSGTTGAPKGVPIRRGAIAACLDGLAQAWGWTANDTLVHGLPLFHVHGLILGVLGALRAGSPLVHTGKPTPEAYAAARGTLYFGVPTVWSRIARDPESAAALKDARLLVSGSAPLPAPVFDRIRDLTGHEIVERYGMTETLITVSARADGDRRPGWVGLPLAGVETRLVSDTGEAVPHDGESVGALQVRGPMVGTEYLGRPDATAESWVGEGWFDTGDVAVIDPTGFHRIVGRASTDLIKTGGFRVGAGEIEAALLGHDDVREAAVVGLPDDDLGQRVVAFVVADGARDDSAAVAIVEFVGQTLSKHKRPREIRFVDQLPRNPMGKVQKKLLL
ncbi:AMP-dependent synthetase and ligase OS=Tsukamurella paurometabola (strain ATCC 8368 / DSM /CCUG 35730 / CIP 100753 / JCM 10117 / KCTC 9821 / NBRC 16120/ NCIMB 702349 / NCTC 13040) OX=521096 GN=Tpau_1273 PE=4 SV=1 [Tsukamurella paurometabola]|uniref:AMP-dependent synthetase and ligase n=1 Tax=Tsukamurella paurometabola (strain ATCC 8368 / DSM 20162 / CCUG 35730 / CIP 100753 / JCM 10117 / KCTC 9821 / NBRC 16120 / NCIMB 702349 / NCTC 13040) TaxID=521096 RepID=D5UWN2_TSUPD|nr:acyl-CoA synthetase [Tsukamurella paurometabola]ADG77904.1 AMP-dependent synthetase and ligase [Tsukamurella paurometabola DSM 20162]SUP29282.1 Long-chain-fatty-acid--CoA ligase [Tsukamurella paurometabola]